MSDKKSTVINMTVAGQPLGFEPNRTAYNNFINEMSMTSKIAPTVTYLGRIVLTESKDALDKLLEEYPGVELQIAEAVNNLYSPRVEIEIKN